MVSPRTLLVLRLAGGALGFAVVAHAFVRFRARELGRYDAALRWAFGAALLTICIEPNSLDALTELLAMRQAPFGRMLMLLVLSNLALWLLLLGERAKTETALRNFDNLVRASVLATPSAQAALRALGGKPVLIALPALDEAKNLPAVLGRIPSQILGRAAGVVVIDDSSRDATVEVVQAAGAQVVSNPFRRGQGAALRLAYDIARRVGAEAVVTLDADGQHVPEEIERVVAPILDDQLDFVIGSRLLGTREADSAVRLLGVHTYNLLINLLAGTRISDCSSGFKAIRVAALDRMVLLEDQFQAAEAIIAASHARLRIGERPITVKRRLSGTSHKGTNLTYAANFARSVFKSWWR